MQLRIFCITLLASAVALPLLAAETPYAGQQNRSIKALSDEDIAALRKGEGMGFAKAAELNGFPGPAHVLTLGDQLSLTEEQRQQVSAIFDRMSAAARPLGATLISHEQALDQLFAQSLITPERLAAETAAIAALRGQLRAVHLTAHLETKSVLSPAQISHYQQLRGYGSRAPATHHHSG
jgi:Spy/CpxP family protein refolding chaperone